MSVVSRGTRVALAAGALALGPVLLAAPAYADTTSPTPIASEPPGGATCLPGTEATCGQDQGVSPTPSASSTPSTSSTPSASPTPTVTSTPTPTSASPAEVAVTTLPVTGGQPTLAHTGGGAAQGWGYAGTALLLGGSVLVLAGRRPGGATRR